MAGHTEKAVEALLNMLDTNPAPMDLRRPASNAQTALENPPRLFEPIESSADPATWDMLSTLLTSDHPEWLGDGRDVRQAENDPYGHLHLAYAWGINNPVLQDRYDRARESVHRQMIEAERQVGRCERLETSLSGVTRRILGQSAADVNEVALLHGTSPSSVLNIANAGLNERLCRGAFGDGVYFAEDVGKADQYVTSDKAGSQTADLHKALYSAIPAVSQHRNGDVFYVFVCRVIMGNYLTTQDGTSCQEEPARSIFANGSRRELSLVRGVVPPHHHHGLVVEPGRKIQRYREFITFHAETNVLPLYLLAYERRAFEPVSVDRDGWYRRAASSIQCTPFSLAVLGTVSAGKSTLLNALLCAEYLPSKTDPETRRLVRIQNDARYGVDEGHLFYAADRSDRGRGPLVARGETDIQKRLSEMNAQCRNGDGQLDFGLVLAARMPCLAEAMLAETMRVVELLDTPGRNEAGAGGAIACRASDDAIIHSQAVLIVVSWTEWGQSQCEDLLEAVLKKKGKKFAGLIVVLNKVDLRDPRTDPEIAVRLGDVVTRLRELGFDATGENAFAVSTKDALLSRLSLRNRGSHRDIEARNLVLALQCASQIRFSTARGLDENSRLRDLARAVEDDPVTSPAIKPLAQLIDAHSKLREIEQRLPRVCRQLWGVHLRSIYAEAHSIVDRLLPEIRSAAARDSCRVMLVKIQEAAERAREAAKQAESERRKKMFWGVVLGGLLAVCTAGLAAPAIGAAFGAAGLSGAAATSSGLAWLGGGSLAAGGFGMAGGTAVIMGAGGLLGAAAGATAVLAYRGADGQLHAVGRGFGSRGAGSICAGTHGEVSAGEALAGLRKFPDKRTSAAIFEMRYDDVLMYPTANEGEPQHVLYAGGFRRGRFHGSGTLFLRPPLPSADESANQHDRFAAMVAARQINATEYARLRPKIPTDDRQVTLAVLRYEFCKDYAIDPETLTVAMLEENHRLFQTTCAIRGLFCNGDLHGECKVYSQERGALCYATFNNGRLLGLRLL